MYRERERHHLIIDAHGPFSLRVAHPPRKRESINKWMVLLGVCCAPSRSARCRARCITQPERRNSIALILLSYKTLSLCSDRERVALLTLLNLQSHFLTVYSYAYIHALFFSSFFLYQSFSPRTRHLYSCFLLLLLVLYPLLYAAVPTSQYL